jgi:hypothetical protein
MSSLAWLLFRHRVDPRDVLEDELERLGDLGVVLTRISPARTGALFNRFVEQFIDAERAAELRDLRADAQRPHRAVELAHWLRPDRARRGGPTGCVRWLSAGAADARCVRFDRRASLPALEIQLRTLSDAWAASWPGVFVNFDAGRAVEITLDYEDVRCDVRAAPATPYR